MKNRIALPVACMAILLGSAESLYSQVTIESTLGLTVEPTHNPLPIFAGESASMGYAWAAMPFMTGSQAYSLSSITAKIDRLTGTDLGVQIKVYAADLSYNAIDLGSPVGTFTAGSVPGYISNITFSSGTPATLAASTRYVAVMQTTSAVGDRVYEWEWSADSYTATNWTIPTTSYYNSGVWTMTPTGNWGTYGHVDSRTMEASFTGTAIPEPSTYAALFGFAALSFAVYRRRRN